MQSPGDDLVYNKPRVPWMRMWLKYRFSVIVYFVLAVAGLAAWHLLSDGDFSFLMTMGSIFATGAFTILVTKVVVSRSVSGISLKTLEAYFIVYVARLSSILWYEGYLPYDKSGDWFYQACEGLSVLQLVALIAAAAAVFKRTYSKSADSFGTTKLLPSEFGVLWLVVPSLLLAAVLHPSLNSNWLTDVAWTFALYLEAVAILPQLFLFQSSREKEVEPFTANFVFCVAMSRALHFVFWLSSYQELNDKYSAHWHAAKYPGYLVVLSQVVNLLIMGDYVVIYLTSARSGRPVLLPQTV